MSEVLSEKRLAEIESELCHVKNKDDDCHECYEVSILIASHRTLQRRVEWTKERPTKEGWYHYKNSWMKDRWTIYEVVSTSDGGLYVMRLNEHVDNLPDNIEWSFIPPPHEARG